MPQAEEQGIIPLVAIDLLVLVHLYIFIIVLQVLRHAWVPQLCEAMGTEQREQVVTIPPRPNERKSRYGRYFYASVALLWT
jgi:hypothetical protein